MGFTTWLGANSTANGSSSKDRLSRGCRVAPVRKTCSSGSRTRPAGSLPGCHPLLALQRLEAPGWVMRVRVRVGWVWATLHAHVVGCPNVEVAPSGEKQHKQQCVLPEAGTKGTLQVVPAQVRIRSVLTSGMPFSVASDVPHTLRDPAVDSKRRKSLTPRQLGRRSAHMQQCSCRYGRSCQSTAAGGRSRNARLQAALRTLP